MRQLKLKPVCRVQMQIIFLIILYRNTCQMVKVTNVKFVQLGVIIIINLIVK